MNGAFLPSFLPCRRRRRGWMGASCAMDRPAEGSRRRFGENLALISRRFEFTQPSTLAFEGPCTTTAKEREGERERGREGERESGGEDKRERECVCVCVCVGSAGSTSVPNSESENASFVIHLPPHTYLNTNTHLTLILTQSPLTHAAAVP